ncbi:MAG: hypothetical protein ABII13_02560 [Patescibacteria group bacterium]
MSEEKKNPVGRPKIKLSDLPDGWEEKMLELGKNGASDVEIREEALGGLCHETWIRLIKEEPKFSETVKRTGQACHSWWLKNGRVNLENKDFSPVLWYMNMKNRFGWKDKQDLNVGGQNNNPLVMAWQETLSQSNTVPENGPENSTTPTSDGTF